MIIIIIIASKHSKDSLDIITRIKSNFDEDRLLAANRF